MTEELYNYGLMVFNNKEDKYKRFLEKNKHLSDLELKQLLDRIEYSNFV